MKLIIFLEINYGNVTKLFWAVFILYFFFEREYFGSEKGLVLFYRSVKRKHRYTIISKY